MRGDTDSDYYAVLGVPHHASTLEIRQAYRRLARRHHPDLNPEPANQGRFVALARAYEVLNDPARRDAYDHTLAAANAPPRPSDDLQPGRDVRVDVCGTIELTPSEAQHLARWPLMLCDAYGGVIVLPAGIGNGDQIAVSHHGHRLLLSVHVQGKT